MLLPMLLTTGPAVAKEPGSIAAPLLPRDLSPWSMFLGADIVAKAVMVGLALASVVTWTVWPPKTLELFTLRRGLRRLARPRAHRQRPRL